MNLTWFGNSAFRLDCGSVVYFDPYKAKDAHDADIILISHGHYDHCDMASIQAVCGDDTSIICPHSCMDKIDGNVSGMVAGDVITVAAVRIEAVAAYNLDKSNHPVGEGVGYIVEAAGKRVYHAGDTDRIPEMKGFAAIDAALLPVGGTFTMDWKEAADAVKDISPKTAIPMHYGDVVGRLEDAVNFRNKVNAETKTKAMILRKGETLDI